VTRIETTALAPNSAAACRSRAKPTPWPVPPCARAQTRERDHVDGVVELAVAAAVESVAVSSARGDRDWCAAGVVVSIVSVRDPNPTSRACKPSIDSIKLDAATQPVQAPDHQRAPCPQVVKAGFELGAMLQRAGPHVTEHPLAPRRRERVDLQIKVLFIGGHAGAADEVEGSKLGADRAVVSEVSDARGMRR
jgi:hypothetical protein